MMRKFNKKKGSRQGAILVTVVFILAFAIIFIAAAMMLTQHTRKRVYTEAESSQARLTVTSVAEAFYRAIQKCEFADADILDLCKGPTTIRVQASSAADTIPGLENLGVTNPDSYTTVYLYRTHTGAGTTNDDYTYYADFSTHIDGQVENVRAELTYVTPTSTGGGKPFDAQVDLNNKFSNNNLKLVGEGKEDDPDNIFLVRHGGKNDNAGFSSYSTLVYCDGAVNFKADAQKSKDIVFLSGAYLKDMTDATQLENSNVENLFFFGDANQPIAQGSKSASFNASNYYFWLCNRSNVSAWTSGAKGVYTLNPDGTSPDVTTTATFREKVQKYYAYNMKYKSNGTENFPTTTNFINQVKDKFNITKDPPSGGQSFGTFLKNNCYQQTNAALASGTYVFNSDGCDTSDTHAALANGYTFAAKEPYVIVLSGNANYRFWFKSGSYGIFNVVFIIQHPTASKPVLFLLAEGAKLYWPGKYNAYYPAGGGTDSSSDGKVCGNGILAVEGRNFDTAEDAFNFVKNCTASTVKAFDNTSNKYSTHYNGTNEPCAMVIGMGKNVFQTDKNIILEAFIGLFNETYDADNPASYIRFRNGDDGVIYGRIMTDGLGFQGEGGTDSGAIAMPASPGASSIPAKDTGVKKVVTGFSLKSMRYYYNITPGEGGT
ncbi:MAG: hypothetical protein IKG03_05320 [Clostridiales bacterium]|nr:hypothetical protein [Clostridiales bacterium]